MLYYYTKGDLESRIRELRKAREILLDREAVLIMLHSAVAEKPDCVIDERGRIKSLGQPKEKRLTLDQYFKPLKNDKGYDKINRMMKKMLTKEEREFLKRIGEKMGHVGGTTTLNRYGKEYFRKIRAIGIEKQKKMAVDN